MAPSDDLLTQLALWAGQTVLNRNEKTIKYRNRRQDILTISDRKVNTVLFRKFTENFDDRSTERHITLRNSDFSYEFTRKLWFDSRGCVVRCEFSRWWSSGNSFGSVTENRDYTTKTIVYEVGRDTQRISLTQKWDDNPWLGSVSRYRVVVDNEVISSVQNLHGAMPRPGEKLDLSPLKDQGTVDFDIPFERELLRL